MTVVEASPFDSECYGVRVARLALTDPAQLAPALAAARTGGFDVVFVRVLETDAALGAVLAAHGAAPLETLVTSELQAPVALAPAALPVEAHGALTDAAEIDRIAAFTGDAIRTSHFHADPRLPLAQTQALYARWMANDLRGRAVRSWIVREGGAPIGALTAVRHGEVAAIDLVAVAPGAQGRGLGSALVGAFIAWVRAEGLRGRVGTQSDNPALALYRRCGFVPVERAQTYHLWLDAR